MHEGRIFYDSVRSDGREFSAYALRPAKALNEEVWNKAKLVRPALIREGGSVEYLDSFGAAVHDGRLCVLIERSSASEPLAELSLQGLGQALAALAAAYEGGALDPADLDIASLRRSGEAFVVLTSCAGFKAPAPSRDAARSSAETNGAIASLREQRQAISSLLRARLGLDVSGRFVPRVQADGRRLAPALRSFLMGKAGRRELSLWAEAAEAVADGAHLIDGCARSLAAERAKDAIELHLSRAKDWAGRRRLGLAAAALVLALVAAVAGPMAWRHFGPPLSAGLSAEELAERYLEALSSLDLSFIDSVLRPPASLPYPHDLYALAAMSAVRRGMQESPLWEIRDASVANFGLVSEGRASAELRYFLRAGEEGFERRDLITMAISRGHWVVIGHEALETTPEAIAP